MTGEVMRRYPGSHRLLIHPEAGRRARAVRTLAGSSDWRRDVVDRFGGAAVVLFGPRAWSEATPPWPWPTMSPAEVTAGLRVELPGLQLTGAAVPRQPGRERLSLLCRYAGNSIIVKLGVDDPQTSLTLERTVLTALRRNPLPGIATPEVVAFGRLADGAIPIDFLATEALGLGAQRPALDVALRTFETDLAVRLSDLIPPLRPIGRSTGSASEGLVPVHGDLTPWNLRRSRRGLALFDWESAGMGEPGSDLAHYRAACDVVRPPWRRNPDRART